MEKKEKKRVMARMLAEELEKITGGEEPVGPTCAFTNGKKDLTNLAGDNDGPLER